MDYADGGDLNMKIKQQKGRFFPEDKVLDWFTQVCLAIKHIHDRKILHRDIKSQNIFLMKNGQVKLGDFGIAKCFNQANDKAKTYVGTPYYLSPEIINSQPYGFKSDIWSLGVLLYEMCALRMPFDASNLPQLYIKIINCNYPPLSNNYSNELKDLVKSMLNEISLKRPNISEILKKPIIKSRIKKFLNEEQYNSEFSHTVLHNFSLNSSYNEEKMSKNDLISNNNINMNNNFINNIRASQGHKRPVIKNDKFEFGNNNRNKNYHYQHREQNNNNLLKKNYEGKAIHYDNKSNRQLEGKYNGNNLYGHNYANNNKKNNVNISSGFMVINDNGRNRKAKVIGRLEFSSDKNGKNIQNNNNNNNNENLYNGLRSENSIRYNNSNKKKIENDKKNYNINISSNRDKDKERRQKLEEAKRRIKRENQNKKFNQDGVMWMKGMENYVEKKGEIANNLNNINNPDNFDSKISNIINSTNDISESDKMLYNDLISNSNRKEKNENNNLSNLYNINNNTYSKDYINEEEINNNNKLYEDLLKGENSNNNDENNLNVIKNNNQDLLVNLNEDLNYGNNLEINEDKVSENTWNEIRKDFGNELLQNISNIIKKYVNDDMLSYDFSKISESVLKDLKYKNTSATIIEKAINKIPDIYYLILCNKI